MNPSDESLLSRFARGRDLAAFDQLHLRYRDRILNFTWRCCGDFQRAEEVTQNTFLKVFRNASRFRFEGRVASWIFRIALNEARGAAEKMARWRRIFRDEISGDDGSDDPPAPAGGPDRIAAGRELEAIARRCLKVLPPRYRRAILLSALEGLSHRRIGEIMGCRSGTVGSLLSRGRRIFRDLFLQAQQGKIMQYPPVKNRHNIMSAHERTPPNHRPDRKAPAGPGRYHPRRRRPARRPSRPLPALPGRG
jgi:RNA polymerase sigma-70 factor (ECF subfamily)